MGEEEFYRFDKREYNIIISENGKSNLIDICIRIACIIENTLEICGHKFKVRPVSSLVTFSPK